MLFSNALSMSLIFECLDLCQLVCMQGLAEDILKSAKFEC
jgi:hypothetical protein